MRAIFKKFAAPLLLFGLVAAFGMESASANDCATCAPVVRRSRIVTTPVVRVYPAPVVRSVSRSVCATPVCEPVCAPVCEPVCEVVEYCDPCSKSYYYPVKKKVVRTIRTTRTVRTCVTCR